MSTALRHEEYYNMQDNFDDLYGRSKYNATKGLRLYDHIISKENILLAFRNIKANTGSKTAGTDGITIDKYKIENVDKFIEEIQKSLKNYKPQTVRRVEIPKPNGKKRPLGHQSAKRIYHATKGYLKNQLNLDISSEKSMVTNLRNRKSDFLGFSLKAVSKRKKYLANTHIMDKKKKNILEKLRYLIREIQNMSAYFHFRSI